MFILFILISTKQPIVDLTITSDAVGLILVKGDPIAFTVSIAARDGDAYYQMDYDDGAGLTEKNATDFLTYKYNEPGEYSVMVQANDLNDTLVVSV